MSSRKASASASTAPPAVEAPAVPAALQTGIQLSQQLPEPFYVQLQRQLQELIDSGALRAGSYLPSERDLADGWGRFLLPDALDRKYPNAP